MRRSTTILGLLGTIAAVATLSSCATFDRDDTAAVVNGQKLTKEQLDTLVDHKTDPGIIRQRLTTWIQIASAAGAPIDATSLTALETVRDQVLEDLISTYGGDGQAQYKTGLDGANYYCLAAIPLAADVKADDVIAEHTSGTSFAELAKKYSTVDTLAASGGVVADQSGTDCFDPTTFNTNFGGILTALVGAKAKVGTPVAIDSGDGTGAMVLLYLRPFAELPIIDRATIESAAIGPVLQERYKSAVVTVNNDIGTWDAATGTVVQPEAG